MTTNYWRGGCYLKPAAIAGVAIITLCSSSAFAGLGIGFAPEPKPAPANTSPQSNPQSGSQADQREQVLNQREQILNQREQVLNQREQQLQQREQWLFQREQAFQRQQQQNAQSAQNQPQYTPQSQPSVTTNAPQTEMAVKTQAVVKTTMPATLSQAEQQIQGYARHIQQRIDEMNQLYSYEQGPKTMADNFQRHGVTGDAMMYKDSWGGGLYLIWDSAIAYYKDHLAALDASLAYLHDHKSFSQSDMQYLAQGMQAWQRDDDQVKELFLEILDAEGHRAAILDQKLAYWKANFGHMDTDALVKVDGQYATQAKVYEDAAGILRDKIDDIARHDRVFSALGQKDRITPH